MMFGCMRVLLVLLSALAQNIAQLKDWNPPTGEVRVTPRLSCHELRGLTGYEFSVTAAVQVTGQGEDHCRVSGQVLPEIRFEVSLPASWNRRLYMFGNGGFAGEPFDMPVRARQRTAALTRGFAVAATDTGHDASVEPLATFAVNRQKLLDYAFRSLPVTVRTAKKLAQAYYQTAPARSYFLGCSTGGRQGLILAQRFPDDFDGIVVGAPVLNFTGTMISYVRIARALAAAPVPESKLKLIADRVYELCDARDGLKDGLIDDPRRCDFSPARDLPKCDGNADAPGCLTPAQITSLETIYSDVTSQGQRIFPGWPAGAEIAGPSGPSGWVPWIVRDGGRTISVNFAESFFRYMAFGKPDPSYDLARFDLDKDVARLDPIHHILDATDTDLSRFRSRGGKIVMYYGCADPALNPRMGVEYYEQVTQRTGASTTDFFRLFMVPGMFHCAGGVGPDNFDALTPVIHWVEKGTAPHRIEAAQLVQDQPRRKRPLCPYPQVARYKGSGSIDDAASFSCVMP